MNFAGYKIPFSDVNYQHTRRTQAPTRKPAVRRKQAFYWDDWDESEEKKIYDEDDTKQSTMQVLKGALPPRDPIERMLQSYSSSRHVRVFVSSTFLDMVDERNELAKMIFPQVRRFCEEHHLFFSYVDLRWGITDEDTKSGETISICLDSIDRCRPYFIGMLGERYGWASYDGVKDELLDKTFENAMSKHPWLSQCRDCSITELEILYSSLFYPELAPHSSFYFRDAKTKRADLKASDLKGNNRLQRLKKTLQASPHPVYHYQTAEQLASLVRDQLLASIRKDFHLGEEGENDSVEGKKADKLVLQRRSHHYYCLDKAKYYLKSTRAKYFPLFDQFAPPLPLKGSKAKKRASKEAKLRSGYYLVSGAPVSGKTALLSAWSLERTRLIQDTGNKELFIPHFLSCGGRNAQSAYIMRRVIQEIQLHFEFVPDEGTMSLSEQFRLALLHASKKGRVVIVLDGLNRLERTDGGRSLSWLPPNLNDNIYIIMSASTGRDTKDMDEAISTRCQSNTTWIAPLKRSEQRDLIMAYLCAVDKKLTEDQINLVLGSAHTQESPCGSPLYLLTLLQELITQASFEALDQHIQTIREAKDTVELYKMILKRWEKELGQVVVSEIFSAILCSQHGLSESEIIKITRLSSQTWMTVITMISPAILERSGLLTLANGCAREAAHQRYIRDGSCDPADVHRRLAKLFQGKGPLCDLSAAKGALVIHHLEQIKTKQAQGRIRAMLIDTNGLGWRLFAYLCTPHRKFDLLRYWRDAGFSPIQMGETCVSLSKQQEHTVRGNSNKENVQLLKTFSEELKILGLLLLETGCFSAAKNVLTNKLSLDKELFGRDHNCVADTLLNLSRLSLNTNSGNDFTQAMQYAKAACAICRRQNNQLSFMAKQQVALLLKKMGQYREAMQEYEGLMKIAQAIYNTDDHPHIAMALTEYADVFRKQNQYDQALSMYQRALAITETIKGKNDPMTANVLNNIGLVQKKKGNYKEADKLFSCCLEIAQLVYGEIHPFTAAVYHNLGDVNRKENNLDTAEQMYRKTIETNQLLLGKDHIDVIQAEMNIALVLKVRGRYKEAEIATLKCLERAKKTVGQTHYKYASFLTQLADVYRKKSEYKKALDIYKQAMTITSRSSLGHNHIEVGDILNNMGLVCKKQGEYSKAEGHYLDALSIAKLSVGVTHPKTATYLTNLGDVYRKQDKYGLAKPEYVKAIKIFEETLGMNHVDMADPLMGLAVVYKKLGCYTDALPLLLRAKSIVCESVGESHPKTATALHNLADVYRKLNETSKALTHYNRALRINEHTLGKGHVEVAENLRCLATMQKNTKPQEAIGTINRALAIVTSKFGKKHSKPAAFYNVAGDVYCKAANYGKAEEIYNEALDLNTALWNGRHPEVAHAMHGLGIVYMNSSRSDAAEERFLESTKMTEETLGPLHPHMKDRLQDLAILYHQMGRDKKAAVVEYRIATCK